MGRKIARSEDALSPEYARVLIPRRLDPQVVTAILICLRQIPDRLPLTPRPLRAVELLIDRLVRVAALGCRDFHGTPHEIDVALARRLGEAESGTREVYLALRSLLGRTVLVEHPSRQRWNLRLAGVADPSSPLHQAFLAEFDPVLVLDAEGPLPGAPVDDTDPRAELESLRRALEAERVRRSAAEAALKRSAEVRPRPVGSENDPQVDGADDRLLDLTVGTVSQERIDHAPKRHDEAETESFDRDEHEAASDSSVDDEGDDDSPSTPTSTGSPSTSIADDNLIAIADDNSTAMTDDTGRGKSRKKRRRRRR